jgi:hypothetical protein
MQITPMLPPFFRLSAASSKNDRCSLGKEFISDYYLPVS